MAHKKKHCSRRSMKRGGAGAPNPATYSSAAGYGMAVNGSGNSQWDRTFIGNGPANYVGVQGQRAGSRKSRKGKNRKGGSWGAMLNQAIVPFALFGMQQSYNTRRNKQNYRASAKNRSRRQY